jgi:glutamate dehydrogenase/leucine dehydrogenase
MVLEWRDPPTGARGWLVINSLRGGAAGGGTRMRAGVTREEVTYLAKSMELKFAFSGPPVGGGKSGIDFDPRDPRRREVLGRWFRDVRPLLKEVYGTGGDLNVDEQRDVVPLCREAGLTNPQQGIVVGHLCATAAREARDTEIERADRALREGLSMVVEDRELGLPGADFRVSDLATGFGVSRAALALMAGHASGSRPLEGLRVIVEGFGTVGGCTALFLARMGARIVGITDAVHGMSVPGGLDESQVEALLRARPGRDLPPDPRCRSGAGRDAVYSTPADLFVPAATSGSITPERLEQLSGAGVKSIVCGANQPFREIELGRTDTVESADREFAVVADAVGSMGMARAFHFLMAEGPIDRPRAVFDAIEETMTSAVREVLRGTDGCRPGMLGTTLRVALDRIGFRAPGI